MIIHSLALLITVMVLAFIFLLFFDTLCTLPPRVLDRRSPAHRSPPPLQTKQTLVGKRKHFEVVRSGNRGLSVSCFVVVSALCR